MSKILTSRHFWVSVIAIAALVLLCLAKGIDVSWPLASIAVGHGVANASEAFAPTKAAPKGDVA